MIIVVYIESLKTFTSGMPSRGMLKELIKIRSMDHFILVLRKGAIPIYLDEMLNELRVFDNWELKTEMISARISNILAFFKFKRHCSLSAKGDIYLNLDAHYLGYKNCPQIITVHDLSSVINNGTSSIPFIKKIARKFIISNGIKFADRIVTISEFTKTDIEANYKNSNEITVIHNGIDNRWYNQKFLVKRNNSKYWIWWGAFNKRKNLINLLFAYEQLLDDNQDLIKIIPDLKLIGNPNDYYFKLIKIVENSELLSKKVIFKKSMRINCLINEVTNSHGLVFPSTYEGFGLPVIEAFSRLVPVLTSNLSSLPEISAGKAILVNPYEISEIKKGLENFFIKIDKAKNDDLRKWASNFTYFKAASNFSNLIEEYK